MAPTSKDYEDLQDIIEALLKTNRKLETRVTELETRLNSLTPSLSSTESMNIFTESSYPYDLPLLNSDVSKETWDYTAIRLLQLNDIMVGYDDNTFKGNQPATRSELASSLFCLITRILKPSLLSETLP